MIENLDGTGVALVTPFNSDRTIDYDGINNVLAHVCVAEINYLVVMGTTGESATLNWREQLNILNYVSKKKEAERIDREN